MDYNVQSLVEKWDRFINLEEDGLPKVKGKVRKETLAVVLENAAKESALMTKRDPSLNLTNLLTEDAPTNSMGASSSQSGPVKIYDPVLISMIRRSMPNLMAFDVCGVQPMTMSTGLIFAMRARYSSQTGAEALFQEALTHFGSSAAGNSASLTAVGGAQVGSNPAALVLGNTNGYTVAKGMSTAAGEALGDSAQNAFNELGLSVESIPVVAVEKGLKTEYSHELATDMKNHHGIDIESTLTEMLAAELTAEINREVIRSINSTATFGAVNTATPGVYDLDIDSNGRWSQERIKGIVLQIEFEANQIAKDTRAGKGNFIITTSDVASALRLTGMLDVQSGMTGFNLNVDDTGNTFAGMLGGIRVYVDPYAASYQGYHYVTVGYRGNNPWDAGLFYCPYVPLQLYKAVGQDSFQPRLGFKTRYALAAHPFATAAADGQVATSKKNKYYRIFAVSHLG